MSLELGNHFWAHKVGQIGTVPNGTNLGHEKTLDLWIFTKPHNRTD